MNTKLILLVIALLLSSCPVFALPPEAASVMKKGLIAAQQQEWNLAIRYFEEARKAAPEEPEVLFNLGLAESKIPGRELRSIAWFNAYLAASPDAANTQAVRDLIDQLDVRVEGAIDRILRQAKQAAGNFPEDYNKYSAYGKVGAVMVETGNPAGAKQEAAALPYDRAESALAEIARALARAGDINGAKEIAWRINGEVWKSSAFQDIAVIQAESGDISGAQLTLESSTHAGYKHSGLIAIGKAQFKAGKKDSAYKTLEQARDSIVRRKAADNSNEYCSEFHSIAGAQIDIGDLDGALETTNLIVQADKSIFDYRNNLIQALGAAYRARVDEKIKSGDMAAARAAADKNPHRYSQFYSYLALKDYDACAGLIEQYDDSYPWKFELYAKLATALLDEGKTGPAGQIVERAKSKMNRMDPATIADFAAALVRVKDLPGAKRAIMLIPADSWSKDSILKSYVEELVKAKEFAEAKQAISTMKDGYDKSAALKIICLAQIAAKDIPGALQTVSLLADSYDKSNILSDIAEKYLSANDPANAKKIVLLMPDGWSKQSSLKKISEWQRKAGDIEGGKLTAMQITDEDYRSDALKDIALEDADRGDFTAAARFIASIPKDSKRIEALFSLYGRQRDLGYFALADATLGNARQAADQITDPQMKLEAYNRIVYNTAEENATRHEAARAIMLSAKNEAEKIADPGKRSESFVRWWNDLRSNQELACMLTESRESFAAAVEAALLMKEDNGYRLKDIASARIGEGDIAGGLETAVLIGKNEYRREILVLSAKTRAKYGNIAGALDMIKYIPEKKNQDDVYLAIVTKQAELNDLAAANRTRVLISEDKKDDAADAVAVAYLKAGDVAAARDAVKDMKKDPSYTLFSEMTRAGALDWAEKIIGGLKNEYSKESFQTYLARGQAKSGDITAAKKTAGLLKGEWNKRDVYMAVAEAGDVSWALTNAATLKDETPRVYACTGIAEMLAKKGDAEAAKAIIRKLKAEKLTGASRLTVASAQVRVGDTDGALETLASVHGRDAEFEAWAAYRIATGYGFTETARWREAADRIPNTELKSKVYLYFVSYMKDSALTRELAAAVPDKFQQSLIYSRLSAVAIAGGDLPAAADLAGLVPNDHYRIMALGRLTRAAVTRGDTSAVRPLIMALPDSAAKTCLLKDVSRPAPDFSLLAGGTGDTTAAASSAATPAAAKNEKLEKWTKLIDSDLNKPMFTDLPGYIQSLAAKTTTGDIFNGLVDAASQTSALLKKLKSLSSQ